MGYLIIWHWLLDLIVLAIIVIPFWQIYREPEYQTGLASLRFFRGLR